MAKKKYTPPPFNYCDYRCDRCDEQEHCKVYKEDRERLLQHYIDGEDPYDPQIYLKDIQKIFSKTKDMIRDMAQKQGINIDPATDEEMPEVNPEEYVLYRLAYEYLRQANALVKELEQTGIPEIIQEDYADFVWYHTLIAAKTGRLVSGFLDDFLDEEMRKTEEEGTLKVIKKGIMLSKNALERILDELPDYQYTISDLMDLLKRLETQIEKDIRQKVGQS